MVSRILSEMKTDVPAEPFVLRHHHILLFSIGVMSKKLSIYDAVRFAWRVNPARAREAEVVLAHVRGLVVGAFTPTEWMEATKKNFPKHEATHNNVRWGFEGVEADEATKKNYVGKRVPDQYPLTQNPVLYIDAEDEPATHALKTSLNHSYQTTCTSSLLHARHNKINQQDIRLGARRVPEAGPRINEIRRVQNIRLHRIFCICGFHARLNPGSYAPPRLGQWSF